MEGDIFLYRPPTEQDGPLRRVTKEGMKLVDRILAAESINEGTLGKFGIVTCAVLPEDSSPKAQVFLAKNLLVPVGVLGQAYQNGQYGLSFAAGIVFSKEKLERNPDYRAAVEEIMLKELSIGRSAIEYVGLFSGSDGKIVRS